MYEKLCYLNDDHYLECKFVVAPGSLFLLSPTVLGYSSLFASEWLPSGGFFFIIVPLVRKDVIQLKMVSRLGIFP
jgi:hypothetical protein